MSTRQVTECDECGAEIPQTSPMWVLTGRRTDDAGHAIELCSPRCIEKRAARLGGLPRQLGPV